SPEDEALDVKGLEINAALLSRDPPMLAEIEHPPAISATAMAVITSRILIDSPSIGSAIRHLVRFGRGSGQEQNRRVAWRLSPLRAQEVQAAFSQRPMGRDSVRHFMPAQMQGFAGALTAGNGTCRGARSFL
ncbi:MAG: hypothetical protein QF462_16150, partial [Myxococcota bacterium]|nr:hypothetical protein [Myxococcota bacterium]